MWMWWCEHSLLVLVLLRPWCACARRRDPWTIGGDLQRSRARAAQYMCEIFAARAANTHTASVFSLCLCCCCGFCINHTHIPAHKYANGRVALGQPPQPSEKWDPGIAPSMVHGWYLVRPMFQHHVWVPERLCSKSMTYTSIGTRTYE